MVSVFIAFRAPSVTDRDGQGDEEGDAVSSPRPQPSPSSLITIYLYVYVSMLEERFTEQRSAMNKKLSDWGLPGA